MLKAEFEALAGYKVSNADYKEIIEPMYMATTLNKAEFIACLNKKRFALPTRRQALNHLKRLAATYVDYRGYDEWHKLEEAVHDYAEQYYHLTGGIDEWCYLKEDTNWNCAVTLIQADFGKTHCVSETLILYSKY